MAAAETLISPMSTPSRNSGRLQGSTMADQQENTNPSKDKRIPDM
jgi:hypothetical protein